MKERLWGWISRVARIPGVWLAALFAVAAGAGVGWGSWQNLCSDCPSIAQIATWEPQQTSKVFSRDGQLIAEFGVERRTPVSIHALPDHVPQAFIAVEDRRFYRHGGFDLRGLTRAGVEAATSFSFTGAGGSTITQQLARNIFSSIGFEKRIERKLKELQVALELERAYSKDQILEAYINQVNYAHGWWGIQTASRNYFGKDATELNPAEAALLAAVVNRPARYTPFRDPQAALQRRNMVLARMARERFIPRESLAEWQAWPLPESRAEVADGVAPYFEEWVRQILQDRFGSQLYTGGLRIHTTLDVRMQRAAEGAMERGFQRVEARPGFSHPKYEEYAERTEPFETALTPYLQGVFIAVDPSSGAVRALLGGRDFNHSKFNRAVQARRQPGSSFKPFVFAAALASGIPASHVIVDSPFVWMQVSGEEWRPTNFTNEFLGPLTLRESLAKSINMVAIKLGWEEVGIQTVIQTAARLGIRSPIPPFPSSSIGASDVIPMEMTEAYSSFASLGTRSRPFPVVRVENADGEVLWEPRPERTTVLDPLVARVSVSMLEEVVQRGTAATAVRVTGNLPYDIPAAGKTGTTNDFTNVWFAGFTPDLVATVWFGMDQPQTIYRGATGGGDAAPVWADFMRTVYVGDPGEDGDPILPRPEPWPMPSEITTRLVDRQTGKLASEWCPQDQTYLEIFIPGTEPTELCDRDGPGLFRFPR